MHRKQTSSAYVQDNTVAIQQAENHIYTNKMVQ